MQALNVRRTQHEIQLRGERLSMMLRQQMEASARASAAAARRTIVAIDRLWLSDAPPYGLGPIFDILAGPSDCANPTPLFGASAQAEQNIRRDWMPVCRKRRAEGRNPGAGQLYVQLALRSNSHLAVADRAIVLRHDSPRVGQGGRYPRAGVELLLTLAELARCATSLPGEQWASIRSAAGQNPDPFPPKNGGTSEWLAHVASGPRLDAAISKLCASLEPDYWPVYSYEFIRYDFYQL
eukprot:SAG31_NODE_4868_length_2899_cov_1.641071_1_plen_238_part_00